MAKKKPSVDAINANGMQEAFENGIRGYQNDLTPQVPKLHYYKAIVEVKPSNKKNPKGSNNG